MLYNDTYGYIDQEFVSIMLKCSVLTEISAKLCFLHETLTSKNKAMLSLKLIQATKSLSDSIALQTMPKKENKRPYMLQITYQLHLQVRKYDVIAYQPLFL